MGRSIIFTAMFVFVCIAFNPALSMAGDPEIYGLVGMVRDGDRIRVAFEEPWRLPKEYLQCSRVYKSMAWAQLLAVASPTARSRQLCGKEAAAFTRKLVMGKRVRLKIEGCDRQAGGLRAFVDIDEGRGKMTSLNRELLRAGLAELDQAKRYVKKEKELTKYLIAQTAAKDAEIGIWGSAPCKLKP